LFEILFGLFVTTGVQQQIAEVVIRFAFGKCAALYGGVRSVGLWVVNGDALSRVRYSFVKFCFS